jgi:hypothetical protein
MAESLNVDREPCIVLSVVPYNDGRRVVRVMGQSLGTIALWVTEGKGKNRQVGKWHPGRHFGLARSHPQRCGGLGPFQGGQAHLHPCRYVSGRTQKRRGIFSV